MGIVINRFFARTMHNCHPAVKVSMMFLPVSCKLLCTRFATATIADPLTLNVATFASGISEILETVSMPIRDRFWYKVLRIKVGSEIMKRDRNKGMRVHLKVLHTTLELVFIWSGLAIMAFIDISPAADAPL